MKDLQDHESGQYNVGNLGWLVLVNQAKYETTAKSDAMQKFQIHSSSPAVTFSVGEMKRRPAIASRTANRRSLAIRALIT